MRTADTSRTARPGDKYDHIVALAVQYNIGLIVRISNPPAWSRAGGNEVGTYAPPDDYSDFADFAGAVAARYRGQVRYYQIWNEPNIYPEWGVYATDPVAYTALLKAGATAIRASDPAAVIIAGALAATIDLDGTTTGGRNFSDLLFLQRMYDAGAAPYFDIMATQGYGLWSGPTDRRMHPRVMNFGRPQFIRDLMVANGDARKPNLDQRNELERGPGRHRSPLRTRQPGGAGRQPALGLPTHPRRLALAGRGQTSGILKRATDIWEQNRQPEAYFRLLAPDFTPQSAYASIQAYTATVRDDE